MFITNNVPKLSSNIDMSLVSEEDKSSVVATSTYIKELLKVNLPNTDILSVPREGSIDGAFWGETLMLIIPRSHWVLSIHITSASNIDTIGIQLRDSIIEMWEWDVWMGYTQNMDKSASNMDKAIHILRELYKSRSKDISDFDGDKITAIFSK